ncbi:dinucleotide-utilizing enzyme, partial [Streptococcus pyogenes]
MTVHPRLVRSIPFWILVAGSVAAIGGGAYILVEKLSNMEATILDNTATGVDVYVGQI